MRRTVLGIVGVMAAGIIGVGSLSACSHSSGNGEGKPKAQPEQSTGDPWKDDQRQSMGGWATYNAKPDVTNVHVCGDGYSTVLCYTVTNHSKWKLTYELDASFYDASGAQIGTNFETVDDVAPGLTVKHQTTESSSLVVTDGAKTFKIDDVQVTPSDQTG